MTSSAFENMFSKDFDEVCDLLKGDLDDETLIKWSNFRNQFNYIFSDMCEQPDVKKVILHGDCWNNNFMYKHAVSLQFLLEILLITKFSGWQRKCTVKSSNVGLANIKVFLIDS
jgi:hypothetical protein